MRTFQPGTELIPFPATLTSFIFKGEVMVIKANPEFIPEGVRLTIDHPWQQEPENDHQEEP